MYPSPCSPKLIPGKTATPASFKRKSAICSLDLPVFFIFAKI